MTITTQEVREMAEGLRSHVSARGGSSLENGFWQRTLDASDMLLALVEERDRLAAAVEELTTENKAVSEQAYSFATENEALTARAEAAEAALKETRAALEPFTTPPLYVLEGEARFVPEKMPDGWIGGGWFSSKDFRRAITAYHKIAHAALKEGRDE